MWLGAGKLVGSSKYCQTIISVKPYPEASRCPLVSVASDLVDPADILFLLRENQPIGFLWLHWSKLGQAEIEPVGILPGYQGRGFGRGLLLSAIQMSAEQGASRVKIGFWRQNEVAGRLYHDLGFKYESSLTYLAYIINFK